MKKRRLITGMITTLLLILSLSLSSCVMDHSEEPDAAHTAASVMNDVFYFNKYTKYMGTDEQKTYASRYEVGTISIYGDVIVIDKTDSDRNYFIESREYDEDNQIYTFHTKDATITFDVSMHTFKVHYDELGGGEVFYINSTIKSNW